MVEHIATRQDVREFRRALDELFALLLDNDDPSTRNGTAPGFTR
ncbi:hypothetical protein [Rhodococcus sp. WB9]|nr:hypothetical protein [Rhodococcus sp. WB9]